MQGQPPILADHVPHRTRWTNRTQAARVRVIPSGVRAPRWLSLSGGIVVLAVWAAMEDR